MKPHDTVIRSKHGISVRNPQAPGPRSRSARCSWRRRYDARRSPIFAAHLHSGVLCIQFRQARGEILLVAISVRACMPGNGGFSLSRTGYWYTLFYFDLDWGSLETTVAGWCHWSQTRFGHARGERSRPHFKTHNSVRPLKNGLSLGGSSATRPCAGRARCSFQCGSGGCRSRSWISVASRGLDESPPSHLFKGPVNPEAPESSKVSFGEEAQNNRAD
jgi:hypothetical protein